MSGAAPRSRPATVLLTGASGVVGRSFLREVHARGDGRRVLAAAHSAPVPEAAAGTVLRCDLTAERFGLDEDSYAALAAEVEVVVHSAGLTEWGLPAERYLPLNVAGTRRVAEFAERAGATVHFMSTAFVAALGDRAPEPLSERNVCRAYIRSKAEAERVLRDSGVPHTVFRPTNLIGEAATGWTSQGQIVQLMSDFIGRGRAPFVPVHPGIRMDFVAQDLLSKAVLRAIELGDDAGEFWVTYGPEAMDIGTCLELLVEHAAASGRTLTPPEPADARHIGPDDLARTPARTRSYLSVLRDVSEVTWCSGGVLPTSMPELRERYGVPYVEDTAAYLTSLEYAAAHLA
ncbi:SDR family oxidoreductase [Streptomyces sp. 891-h]|uniref:SDR family oxidoreductase n=1 Tax=unclassified Streptomyces TaxID=2593676 RepID=UPI001FA98CD7|nr:SDR family oxidoreductase [Streptomyces sp. 891-h]UNZ19555.1 NAD-dependent epimerase/dehydratase family protein [Streptomyces sp. 891-h]